MTAIKSRKPTGAVPWPLVLVEGAEKTGKSWALAEFTASEKVGQAYWLDLGEGAADEYAAIPGADYLVIEHDGTWADIVGQVSAVRQEAQRAHTAGEKPVVLLIDSMTAEWDLLKDWATARAVSSKFGQRILAKDPNAEVKPDNRLWNDANTRHSTLMRMLMTFPGIVVMTARGKEVAVMGTDGKPVAGQKDYRVEGQKNLAFDSSAWVRLSRDEAPKVVGVRSVHSGVRPGVDKPKPAPQFTVEWLVFDVLKCDPKTAKVRDLQDLDSSPDQVAVEGAGPRSVPDLPLLDADYVMSEMNKDITEDRLKELWDTAKDRLGERRTEVFNLVGDRLAIIRAARELAEAGPEQPTLDSVPEQVAS